jgi:hypothetical protein
MHFARTPSELDTKLHFALFPADQHSSPCRYSTCEYSTVTCRYGAVVQYSTVPDHKIHSYLAEFSVLLKEFMSDGLNCAFRFLVTSDTDYVCGEIGSPCSRNRMRLARKSALDAQTRPSSLLNMILLGDKFSLTTESFRILNLSNRPPPAESTC